ncbi:MAG: hypothetical protein U0Y68_25250 [Blastocatellia bacterium]
MAAVSIARAAGLTLAQAPVAAVRICCRTRFSSDNVNHTLQFGLTSI